MTKRTEDLRKSNPSTVLGPNLVPPYLTNPSGPPALRPRELLPNSGPIMTGIRGTSTTALGSMPGVPTTLVGNPPINTHYSSLSPSTTTTGAHASSSTATTATTTTNTNPLATSPRRSIPGFVSKLFRMVSEGGPGSLIRWTEEGNSFVVTRPEEFSRTILPRYFKHNNFSSFVRQLNMYGFHKVPQVAPTDQPIISASSSTASSMAINQSNNSPGINLGTSIGTAPVTTILDSIWEFTNPNFIRGRPDLLLQVRRKTGGKDDEPSTSTNLGNINGGGTTLGMTLSGSGADVIQGGLHAMVQELTALRAQQNALRSDLATLQRDSQLLWGETLAARERHQNQQSIIDKILRFLASVFSSTTEVKNLTGQTGPAALNVNLTPRKRPLLIEEIPSTPAPEEVDELFAPIVKSNGNNINSSAETPQTSNHGINPMTGINEAAISAFQKNTNLASTCSSGTGGHQNRLFEALRTADAIQGDLDFLVDNLDPALLQAHDDNPQGFGDSTETLPLDLDWDTYTNLYPPSQPDDLLLPLDTRPPSTLTPRIGNTNNIQSFVPTDLGKNKMLNSKK